MNSFQPVMEISEYCTVFPTDLNSVCTYGAHEQAHDKQYE